MSILSTIGNTKITTGLIGAGLGVTAIGAATTLGAFSFGKKANDDPRFADQSITDKIARVGASSIDGGILAGVGSVGVGYGLYNRSKGLSQTKVSEFIPKGLKETYVSNPTINKEFLTKTLSNTKFLAAGGLGIGAIIGSQVDKDDPKKGAAIGGAVGGGVGILGSLVAKSMKLAKNVNPAVKVAAIALGSVGLAAGTRAIVGQHQYDEDAESVRDNWGDYNNIPGSGIKNRLNTINASGNIAFGLHKKRHG